MLKHFRLKPFLLGALLGLFVVLFYKTPTTSTLQYPHPQNVDTRVYRDKNGVCYRYRSQEVGCDDNEGTLRPYPLQG